MKNLIETLLAEALAKLPEDLVPAAARGVGIEVESTRDAQHGDFATKATRQNPRKIAEALRNLMPASGAVSKVEIAGAGFINFFLTPHAYHDEIRRVLELGPAYGRSQLGLGVRVQV